MKNLIFLASLLLPLSVSALECSERNGKVDCDDSSYSGRKLATKGYYRTNDNVTVSSRTRGSTTMYEVNGAEFEIMSNGVIRRTCKRCTKKYGDLICD